MKIDGRIGEILEEIRLKQEAQAHLASYAEYALGVVPAAHHQVICSNIDALLADEFDELIILAPPGSAKSTYTSIALSSYFIGRFPDQSILTCSYSTELAEKWGRRVRNQVASMRHAALFPNCQLSKDSLSAGRWSTSLNGEFYAAGVGSGILGFRADLGVIDDPISGFEQAQSTTQLAKVHNWYETDFITRLKPRGKVVLICQRLARYDLAGYLIDRNEQLRTRRQRVLSFPMESEGAGDLLGRPEGALLWPEWFTPEMADDAKRDQFKWRTLYQQKPPSESGSWVDAEEVLIRPGEQLPPPESLQMFVASDIALSINRGDYSLHMAVGVDSEQNIFVLDVWRGKTDVAQTAQAHMDICHSHQPIESLIDDDNASKVYAVLLYKMAREQNRFVPYKPMPLRGQDKETRAAAIRGWFKRRKVFLKHADWNKWVVEQILLFPNAVQDGMDDAIDALSLIGRRLAIMSPKRSSRDKSGDQDKPWTVTERITLDNLFRDRESRGYNVRI